MSSYTDCRNCGQVGHYARQCTAPPEGAALQTGMGTDEAELQRQSTPSGLMPMTVGCPWCGSSPWEACVNRAAGRRPRGFHEARLRALNLHLS